MEYDSVYTSYAMFKLAITAVSFSLWSEKPKLLCHDRANETCMVMLCEVLQVA